MGLAGSGKGTQGELLAKTINYNYFSTGEYLRTYITEKRRQEMLQGILIDDKEMIEIIGSYLDTLSDKNLVILDGFPRTLGQAEWLYNLHEQAEIQIEGIIYIHVAESELLRRLLERARPDDTEPAIKKRFQEYISSTAPVIDYYKSQSIRVIEINGNDTIDRVQDNIVKMIKK
jgi:adenylate kinase